MTAKYRSAPALRAALDKRVIDEASLSGRDPNWIRRRLAFTRLLVRLVDAEPDAWVVKGGIAVELRRPGVARATRDLDLVLRPGLVDEPDDGANLRDAMVEALLTDPGGDGFAFSMGTASRLRDDAYARPAWRFPVDCTLAGRTFVRLRLDVVARPEEIGGVERRTLPDVLGFAGIPTASVWVVDLRQQFAEKLHALTRTYLTGETTRVKDLLDLVLLIEDGVPADADLVARTRHVFAVRRSHPVPDQLSAPPPAWQQPYSLLAREIGVPSQSSEEAHAIVASHWQRARECS